MRKAASPHRQLFRPALATHRLSQRPSCSKQPENREFNATVVGDTTAGPACYRGVISRPKLRVTKPRANHGGCDRLPADPKEKSAAGPTARALGDFTGLTRPTGEHMQPTAAAPKRATRDVCAPEPEPSASRNPARQYRELLRRLALPVLPRGSGRAYAPLIFLFLASHLRWRSHTKVWPSNARIAQGTGLPIRSVERGLAYLRIIGKVSVSYGPRPASRSKRRPKAGRLLELNLLGAGANPVVRFPSPQVMAGIWRQCAAVRERPAALVALAVAEFVYAAAEQGADVTEATSVTASIASLRALVGAAHGAAFNRRLDELACAGLLVRIGKHWRDGARVQLPARAPAVRPARLPPAPLRRFAQMPAANDGVTLEDMLAIDAQVAASHGWRARGGIIRVATG